MLIINSNFRKEETYTHTISHEPLGTTDDYNISSINANNDLIANKTGNKSFSLRYNGDLRNFTSTINLNITGITDLNEETAGYNTSTGILTVPIQCNGTLKRDSVKIHNSSSNTVIIHIKKVGGNSAPNLTIKFQIGNDLTDNWIISRNQESVNPNNNTDEINDRLTNYGYVLYNNSSSDSNLDQKLISFKINEGKSLWIEADDTIEDNTKTSNKTWCNESQNLYFADDTSYNEGKLEISGDIMSLITENSMGEYCFKGLFKNFKSLKSVSENFLSPNKLSKGCYMDMFYKCTSLTTAPELPAMTLATECYREMFEGCTSLITAPELPATSLLWRNNRNEEISAEYCYAHMFFGCESLTTAPELPVENLARSCYMDMFHGCTLLETVPKLNAKILDSECCSSMFDGCINLTTIPTLSASTLASSCYKYMFSGCTNLNEITILATDINASECLVDWLPEKKNNDCKLYVINENMINKFKEKIPSGWTVQVLQN